MLRAFYRDDLTIESKPIKKPITTRWRSNPLTRSLSKNELKEQKTKYWTERLKR
jgi:hypothetical protein